MNSNPPDLALQKAAGPGPMLSARLFGGAESTSVQEQSRKLGNHCDALDAFRGLLARTPFKTFWGIPLLGVQDSPTTSIQGIGGGFVVGAVMARCSYSTGEP